MNFLLCFRKYLVYGDPVKNCMLFADGTAQIKIYKLRKWRAIVGVIVAGTKPRVDEKMEYL